MVAVLPHAADPDDRVLDLEFAYTSHQQSCRDLYSLGQWCRRPSEHEGLCASGFGSGRRRWPGTGCSGYYLDALLDSVATQMRGQQPQ